MNSNWRNVWFLAALAIIAVSASGCIVPDQIDPPRLQLETGPSRPSPTLTKMRIENGAGEAIYDGSYFNNPLTYDPNDPRFDGTIKITRTYSDGTVKEQTFTHARGTPVHLDFNWNTREYELKERPTIMQPSLIGGLRFSYDFINRPDTQIVRQDRGGQLAGFIKADNESSNPGFEGSVGLKMDQPLFGVGRKWGLELFGKYYSSTARENINVVPTNGGDNAILGPLPGGGANFGMNEITDLRYRSDYTTWSVQPRFSKSYGVGTLYSKPLHVNSYVGFNYGKNEDDEELSGQVPGVGVDFMTGSWIDNWYYGPEFGFDAAWYWCPPVKLKIGGFAKVNVNDLTAKRMIQLSNGLNGTDEFSDTEVTVGGGANVALSYKWNNYFSAKVGFEYEYANDTPVVNVNPQTGVGSVDAEGADIYRIVMGARINF